MWSIFDHIPSKIIQMLQRMYTLKQSEKITSRHVISVTGLQNWLDYIIKYFFFELRHEMIFSSYYVVERHHRLNLELNS